MWKNWTTREKKLFYLSLLLGLFCFGSVLSQWLPDSSASIEGFQGGEDTRQQGGLTMNNEQGGNQFLGQAKQVEKEEQANIWVDVKGAVHKPGVYKLEKGQRTKDALEKAGGAIDEALTDAINLAEILRDGMVVYVPHQEEANHQQQQSAFVYMTQGDDKIDLNHATAEQLESLPGIGPSRALTIIRYRDEHGPFPQTQDLMNVSGIGQATYERLAADIVVR